MINSYWNYLEIVQPKGVVWLVRLIELGRVYSFFFPSFCVLIHCTYCGYKLFAFLLEFVLHKVLLRESWLVLDRNVLLLSRQRLDWVIGARSNWHGRHSWELLTCHRWFSEPAAAWHISDCLLPLLGILLPCILKFAMNLCQIIVRCRFELL